MEAYTFVNLCITIHVVDAFILGTIECYRWSIVQVLLSKGGNCTSELSRKSAINTVVLYYISETSEGNL